LRLSPSVVGNPVRCSGCKSIARPDGPSLRRSNLAYNSAMRRMAAKGPPPVYTETCTNCVAVIPVRDVINIDAEHKRCPKCGEAYNDFRYADSKDPLAPSTISCDSLSV